MLVYLECEAQFSWQDIESGYVCLFCVDDLAACSSISRTGDAPTAITDKGSDFSSLPIILNYNESSSALQVAMPHNRPLSAA
jgi:hypothetical protein